MLKIYKRILFLLFTIISANILANSSLLEVNKAFNLSSKIVGNDIVLNWHIADGYYLYKEKIKISSSILEPLGRIKFPVATIKDDEFFGRVGIYRNNVNLVVPTNDVSTRNFTLFVSYQGCADIGVCYPQVTTSIKISLPKTKTKQFLSVDNVAKGANSVAKKINQSAKSLFGNFLNSKQDDGPLDPEKAFIFSISVKDAKTLVARWDILRDYYLYHNKFTFAITGADYGTINIPKGKIKQDEYFGKIQSHTGVLEVELPLINISSKTITTNITYQGCWEGGVCYPPQRKITKLSLPDVSINDTKNKDDIAIKPKNDINTSAKKLPSIDNQIAPDIIIENLLKQDNFWLVLLSFFGFGLLLSFTPCVFPMIPILSSIIVGKADVVSTKKAFIMSLVFVLSMSITYTIAGVIAGYFGENLQILFQNKWSIILFSSIFVALAISMFGYYDIQMPAYFRHKANNITNKQESSLIGVAIMGLFSALIVGPCIAPPLAGALIYIGHSGDIILGGAALFTMSIGMGIPLIIIGTSAGKLLPKVGAWMDKVKAIFGISMLAVAIYLLERIIDEVWILFLWASLFTISMAAMGAFKPLSKGATPWQGIFKAIGLLIFAYGLLLFLLVAKGGGNMLQPLASFNISNNQNISKIEFSKITNITQLDTVLLEAKNNNKLVMLDFYADWCIYCKELEKNTFTDSKVVNSLADFITLKADVTKNNADDKELMAKFDIIAPPAILFFKNGVELRGYRIVGEISNKDFINKVKQMLLYR